MVGVGVVVVVEVGVEVVVVVEGGVEVVVEVSIGDARTAADVA